MLNKLIGSNLHFLLLVATLSTAACSGSPFSPRTETTSDIRKIVTSPAKQYGAGKFVKTTTTSQPQDEETTSGTIPYFMTGESGVMWSERIPNPQAGVYVVVSFLVLVGAIVITWLTVVICRQRRRMLYRQPSRDSRLRQEGAAHTDFSNPIQFPSAAYNTSMVI